MYDIIVLEQQCKYFWVVQKSSKPHQDFTFIAYLSPWFEPNLLEIKTEIWISFSSFMKCGSELPQEKSLAVALLSKYLC